MTPRRAAPHKRKVLEDVCAAIDAAFAKHGALTHEPVRACAILSREVAEAMDEALLATKPYPSPIIKNRAAKECRARMYDELAQVAATAIAAMRNINEELGR